MIQIENDYDELSELTGYFLDNGELHEHFEEILGEKCYQMVEEAIEYTKSLFEKS